MFLITPKSSIPFTVLRILSICIAIFSDWYKSFPNTLTAIEPLTPEAASSTLSEIG